MTTSLADLDFAGIEPADRLLIAQALLDSVLYPHSHELSDAQLAELQARIDDIESGRVQCIPWELVRERLWRRA